MLYYIICTTAVDEKAFKKANPEKYQVWKLEQMINWGLGGEKLDEVFARKYWGQLFLDPIKKKCLAFLSWPAQKKLLTRKS